MLWIKLVKIKLLAHHFSIELNKILADKYKDKVDTKRIDDDIKKKKNNMVVKINLKVC